MRREPYGGRGCRAPVRASPISTGEPGWNCMDQAVSQLEKGADDRFPVRRSGKYLRPDNSRMLLRPFLPGGDRRVREVIHRVLDMTAVEVEDGLQNVVRRLSHKHASIETVFSDRYQQLAHLLPPAAEPSPRQALLIGAYFMSEYSLQSAALFNPSVVPHPSQEGVPDGALRFVMSLRATGEGHISSIEFRAGLVSADGDLTFDPVSRSVLSPEVRYPRCHKADFVFGFQSPPGPPEREIFPASPSEQGGIEDARFLRFREDDGSHRYYATYTAFDRNHILPQLIQTEDFLEFRLRPLHGAAAQNKGMALFPRRVGGRYAMLGRQGGVNITLMFSDDVHRWEHHEVLMEPEAPWEYIQIGNCGSPLETEAGWLVLTHGVGAMRIYCIGAALLDLEDPRRVIGRLRQPLLEPLDHERDGYVPNVVYSCGSLIHNGWLVVPYAVSDYATTHALAQLEPLLERLVEC